MASAVRCFKVYDALVLQTLLQTISDALAQHVCIPILLELFPNVENDLVFAKSIGVL